MLFNEIYGCYYNTVAEIIAVAQNNVLSRNKLNDIVRKNGFQDSALEIPQALYSKAWPFLDSQYHTTIQHKPATSLTTLEKQWLKAILLDPRINLFEIDTTGLEDVEPLFYPEDIVYYDQYSDADPYADKEYIKSFRFILNAIHEKKAIRIQYESDQNKTTVWNVLPQSLEYSEKDDKFRVQVVLKNGSKNTLNVSRIKSCEFAGAVIDPVRTPKAISNELVFDVSDDKNTMERALLHFSHYEKKAEKLDDHLYRISVAYQKEDEKEILIRVLSFGPTLHVIAPDGIISAIRQRVREQIAFNIDKTKPL